MSYNSTHILNDLIKLCHDLIDEDLNIFIGGGSNLSSESDVNIDKSKELEYIKKLIFLLIINLGTTFIYGLIYYIIRGDDNFIDLDNDSSLMDCLYFSFAKTSMVISCDISAKSEMAKLIVMTQQILILGEILFIFMLE